MHALKVNECAKELKTTGKWIREQLVLARMIHQDANLRWCSTRFGRELQTVTDAEGCFYNQTLQKNMLYSVLKITPKGQKYLHALLNKEKRAA